MRIRGENYNSNYIGFTISKNLVSSDNAIVKIENGKYLVKTMTPYKYHDLPIANANGKLGIVTIGDNLTIDSSGRLSSTGGGLAATVTVGTTTTGEAGTNASVTNSGTSQEAVLNFVIPRGANGENGTDGQDGTNGREIEMQVTDTYIQWRYVGDTTWYNLIALSELKGAKGDKGDTGATGNDGTDGKEVTLQATDTYIQWKYDTDTTWTNLIPLSDLKGEKGEQGLQGTTGQDGITPNIQVGNTTTLEAGSSATVTQRGTTENPIFDFGIPKGADGTGGITNYNELTNRPVINLSSEDNSNPICLFDLDEGIYKLYGYVKYYPTYSGTTALSSPTLVTVQKSSTTTYIQLLQPYGNKIIGYEITSESYTSTEIEPVKDSGWINATLTSNFKAYGGSSTNTPQYRKIGKIIYIRGIIAPTAEIASGASKTIFTLPNGYRPTKPIYCLQQGSVKNSWLCAIDTSGSVSFQRYGASGYIACPTTAWLPFQVEFTAD